MSGGGSGGGSSTTVQKADPWSGLQPYLTAGYQQAGNIYQGNPSQYYPGQTYLPMNQLQSSALDAQLGNVSNLQNISGGAQGGLGSLLGAADLQNNPYAQQYMSSLGGNMAANLGTTANQLGRAFQTGGQDLGLQNQALIGQQQRALGATGDQYSNQLADLTGQQQRAFGAAGTDYANQMADLMGQQQRAYDVGSSRLYDTLMEQALPGIAQDAIAAGQSGSSRQGVAEGIALGKFGQSLSDLARANSENLGASSRTGLSALGNLARTGQENLGSTTRSAVTGLGNLARTGQENLGSMGRTGLSNLADVARTGQENLGSTTRSAVTGLGNLARSGTETLGQSTLSNLIGRNQLAREQAGQLGDVATRLGAQGSQDLASFMSGQYGQGLEAIKSGLTLSPTVAGLSQLPSQTLSQVGDVIQQENMKPLQQAMDQYYYNQQAPWQDLSQYISAINGLPGGQFGSSTSTSTQDLGGNKLGSAIGGGMAGAGLAGALGLAGPWGWGLAGLGALGGLL